MPDESITINKIMNNINMNDKLMINWIWWDKIIDSWINLNKLHPDVINS